MPVVDKLLFLHQLLVLDKLLVMDLNDLLHLALNLMNLWFWINHLILNDPLVEPLILLLVLSELLVLLSVDPLVLVDPDLPCCL